LFGLGELAGKQIMCQTTATANHNKKPKKTKYRKQITGALCNLQTQIPTIQRIDKVWWYLQYNDANALL
jgi:hypothetical protein